MSIHCELLIDGHFIGGPCDQAVGKDVIRNPYDGSIVGTAAEGGWSELNTCLDAATDAFKSWRNSTKAERQMLLRGIAELVRERADELTELLTLEIGKPITLSKGEVTRLALTFEFAANELDRWEPEQLSFDIDPRGKDYTGRAERFPIGPIFAIVPYNWPLNLAAHKIAPALATGNTLILKPSPLAPLSTLSLARLIHEAGCPPGVLNAWNGPANLAQRACEDSRVKMLSFTGSVPVGWKLKELLPQKRVVLELGGDATAIVCADADLDWAIPRLISGGYGYAGQICISIQHVLVEQGIYEEVRRRLIEGTLNCPTGDPRDPKVVCGPLISADAADEVQSFLDEAVAAGAEIIVGGERNGNVIRPTLIEGVPCDTKLGREEVFGPVMTLRRFDALSNAIDWVNASSYGIQCGIFTRNSEFTQRAFRDLEVGGMIVNDYPTLRFDNMPYGGEKRSGFGREGVRYAMEEMTTIRALVERPY